MTLGLNTKRSGALMGGLPLEIWNLARSRGGAGQDYMAITKTRDADLAFGLWLTGFNKTMAAFEHETGNRLQRHNITLKTASGVMYVNGTCVLGVNVSSPAEFTAAVLECYRQIEAVA